MKEKKKKSKKIYITIAIIVFSIIMIDQITKFLIINNDEIVLIKNVLVLNVQENSFGTYEDASRGLNILTNILIIGIIFGIIKSNNQFITRKTKILLSFALAGGISNIIDRICRGNVIEFINIIKLPPLNIADICIAIGWISFVAIFTAFSSKELSAKRKKRLEDEK